MTHRIVIVGGGFGGVSAAKHIAKMQLKNVSITLISNRPDLEYYGALYRILGGSDASEVILPLELTVDTRVVTIAIDSVKSINPTKKNVEGKSKTYAYDTLILAPGSVPAYFGIPGMEEHSITMKSSEDALALKQMVIEKSRQKVLDPFIIVGAGPTGIEIAGEILPLARRVALSAGHSASCVKVTLIEAMDRLLPNIEPKASAKVLARLQRMGVNLMLNTAVASAEKQAVILKDGTTMNAGTIIWTAGIKAHPLIGSLKGVELDKRGRAVVDDQLRIKGMKDIFVLGDCASTKFSGMAQTAFDDGIFVAHVIAATLQKSPLPLYKPKAPAYAIPAGKWWAAVKYGVIRAYGFPGYVLRRLADIHVYMLVLPWRYIPAAYTGHLRSPRLTTSKARR